MKVNKETRIWMSEQLEYLKKISKKDKLVLKIYSESYLFKLLNNFCNQIIDPETILEYDIEEENETYIEEYLKIKNIKQPDEEAENIEYFIFVIDLIISITKDLISIIINSPPTPDVMVYRGTKNYYYSKEDNILINYGFVSTSLDEEVAEIFTDQKTCCLFKVLIPKGTRGIYLSLLDLIDGDMEYEEYELVLPPYSKFKLIDTHIPITKWYEFSELNEYTVTYEGNETTNCYDQFEIYKDLLLSIYIDKNINKTVDILKNNPINMSPSLFKLIYDKGIFKDKICNIILDKKIKIKVEYILYAIKSKIDNTIILNMIEKTKEVVLKEPFTDIVLTAKNNNNLELIKYLNLHYTEYMNKYINSTFKNKLKSLFNRSK